LLDDCWRRVGYTRWHLRNLCGVRPWRRIETRRTEDIDPELLCLRCARAAAAELTPAEAAQPHGAKIVAAAARHMGAIRVSPVR
jgi:hypothetical protein